MSTLLLASTESIEKVIVVKRVDQPVDMEEGRDVWWHDAMAGVAAECPCEPMDSEDLLYLLYTSGTTAKPKGIMHTTGGYLTQVAFTHKYVFDLHPDTDVYWCAADIGWVTGHSYIVYGPLANGATSVIYEGTPDTPAKDRLWDIAERYGVTILYTAPTAIRTFMKWGAQEPEKHDLSSLRLLGSVGEPINPEAWMWYHTHIGGGRCPVVDTWWQTETGAIMISPLPGATTLKPGSATFPLPGIAAELVDDAGQSVERGGGYLTLTRPWPSMLRGIYGDPERYRETYWSRFEGRYFAGDGCKIDDEGYFWLLGRVDDVMNVSGHRISTTEVESALVDHQSVAEAAVVGAADGLTGQAIMAYVIVRGGTEVSAEMGEELRAHVATKIGPTARPKTVIFTEELPKTRSGKIMRRLLRDVAEGRQLGDTTTLADPNVVEEIRARAARHPPRSIGRLPRRPERRSRQAEESKAAAAWPRERRRKRRSINHEGAEHAQDHRPARRARRAPRPHRCGHSAAAPVPSSACDRPRVRRRAPTGSATSSRSARPGREPVTEAADARVLPRSCAS